jgi:hypothetical protein
LDIAIQSSTPLVVSYLAKGPAVVMKGFNLDIGMRRTSVAVNLVLFHSSLRCCAISVFVTPNIMKVFKVSKAALEITKKEVQ